MSILRNRLGRDSQFQKLMGEWKKSDIYRDLQKQIDKKQVKIPRPKPWPSPPSPVAPSSQHSPQGPPRTVCDHCDKTVDTDGELFYTISKEPARSDKLIRSDKRRVLSFHSECFLEIAGEEFT